MNYAEAMLYLEGTERFGSRLGLERMTEILGYLGSPEKGRLCLHIAGTNGKGSVSAYSAYMLAAEGLRVGLYCSPYVYDFGERIRVLDGRSADAKWAEDPRAGQISEAEIARTLTLIRDTVEKHGMTGSSHPTHFEMLTLMAFLHFAKEDCDVWVLETGLGGRLDSTNCVPAPKAAVITAIGLDHTNRLGNTYTAIASEKAGILKKGTEVLCLYDQRLAIPDPAAADEVTELFADRARSLGIRLEQHRHEDVEVLRHDLSGQTFRLRDMPGEPYFTKLLPGFEPDNAALAIKAVKALYPSISEAAIRRGLETCYWPARLEKLSDKPVILIDGGHNPQGARALRKSLDGLFPEKPGEVHVCSIMKDKDRERMFREIFKGGQVRLLLCTAPRGVPRATPPDELAAIAAAEAAGLPETARPVIRTAETVEKALEEGLDFCREHQTILLAWGTFYQAGEFRAAAEAGVTHDRGDA